MLYAGMNSTFQDYIGASRELYVKAESDQRYAEELLELSGNQKDAAVIFQGYHGAANMMIAKHVGNPFSKLSYFKNGKKILEEAIQADKENIELRFLRFSVQSEAPGFLGYRDAVEEDKKLLLQGLNELEDPRLKQMIRSFLMKTDYLSEAEKQRL